MTRDEFIAEHLDELVGLLMRSFAKAAPRLAEEPDQKAGRDMMEQFRRARDFLGRAYDRLTAKPKEPSGNVSTGTDTITRKPR